MQTGPERLRESEGGAPKECRRKSDAKGVTLEPEREVWGLTQRLYLKLVQLGCPETYLRTSGWVEVRLSCTRNFKVSRCAWESL